MGFIRGGLLVIVCVLSFITIIVGNMFLMASLSLEYDNVNSELNEIVQEIEINGANITEVVEVNIMIMNESCFPGELCDLINSPNQTNTTMEKYCSEKDNYIVNYSEYLLNISCDSVAEGSDAVLDEAIDEIIEEIYEDDYNCSGIISCFKESDGKPFFILSEQTKDSLQSKFYWCLFIFIILVVLTFILVKTKTNALIILGSLMIIGSVPFIKMYEIVSWIFRWDFIEFVKIFFTESLAVFWVSFIIGFVLLALGILMKVFGLGFKIEGLVEKIFGRK